MKYKYSIVVFLNKKQLRVLYRCNNKNTVYKHWREYKKLKPPRFTKKQIGKRNQSANYELVLVFPMNRWVSEDKFFVRDSIGRLVEALIDDNTKRIKEIIPFWEEELIYDHENKKRIPYEEFFKIIMEVTEISQLFTLNNKLFIQTDDNVRMFGNKNINDAQRLFDITREDLLKEKKGNFIFVKDLTTAQRTNLYNLLEAKGYKRRELFRHYSY
jgi:hypothetical protein